MRGFYAWVWSWVWARVWAWASCGAAFERPHATRGARREGLFLAPALIAARPVKPCDGGVLGALNSLLKMKRNAPGLAQNRSAETAIQGAKTPRLFPKARGVQIKTKSRLYARFLRRRHAAAPPSRPPSAARPQPFMAGTAAGCGAGRQLHTGCVTSSTRSHMAKP